MTGLKPKTRKTANSGKFGTIHKEGTEQKGGEGKLSMHNCKKPEKMGHEKVKKKKKRRKTKTIREKNKYKNRNRHSNRCWLQTGVKKRGWALIKKEKTKST